MFSSELQLQAYLVAHPELLNFVVVREGVTTLRNGWLDILGMNEEGTLENVELKLRSTCGNTMGQILDYAHWTQRLSMNDVVDLAEAGENSIDLRAVFEMRFGRPLPTQLGERPRTTLIAARFDRRTIHGIEYLKREGVPIRALRWVESSGSVQLLPFSAHDLVLQESRELRALRVRRSERAKRTAAKRAAAPWAPTKFKVHDDIADFWTLHSHQFVWDFLPSSFVFAVYERWRKAEALSGLSRKSFARAHLSRHLNQFVYETGGWRYRQQFRARSLMNGREPLATGLTWERPDPGDPIGGYLRARL